MHNCYSTKIVLKASGGSFSTVFAKRGYTAPRCQSTLKIIYPLSSTEAQKLLADRFRGLDLGMLTMAYPRFPAYEGNYFINTF